MRIGSRSAAPDPKMHKRKVSAVSDENPYGVKVGQVWSDNDMRTQGRRLKVVSIDLKTGKAKVEIVANDAVTQQILDDRNDGPGRGGVNDRRGKHTHIKLRRFRPNTTGYTLVEDVT